MYRNRNLCKTSTTSYGDGDSTPLRILTVGDGDLSFSLALKRAFPQPSIRITASTLLPTEQELLRTYSNSSSILKEFCDVWNERVIYNVDATHLDQIQNYQIQNNKHKIQNHQNELIADDNDDDHTTNNDGDYDYDETNNDCGYNKYDHTTNNDCEYDYDLIMFNHPHLGDKDLFSKQEQESSSTVDESISEQRHALRHHVLLCHYFDSAKKLLLKVNKNSNNNNNNNNHYKRIHVCLCGTQPETWNLQKAAQRCGLKFICQVSTSTPLSSWLFGKQKHQQDQSTIVEAQVQKHYPCPRKYRNGKLGSKHALGRYGYAHKRTGGDLYGGNANDMMVNQSVNFVFALDNNDGDNDCNGDNDAGYVCTICGLDFSDDSTLKRHLNRPAIPDIMTGDFMHEKITISRDEGQHNQQQQYHDSLEIPNQNIISTGIVFENSTTSSEPSIESNSASILLQATVAPNHDSKRIKWLCRQEMFPLSKYMTSKRLCKEIIQSGRIYVNGIVATDETRIVKENDVITLLRPNITSIHQQQFVESNLNEKEAETQDYGVTIVKNIPINVGNNNLQYSIIVAQKPVGMRVVGSFAPNTLEMTVRSILLRNSTTFPQDLRCTAVSKLETGCGGLCVLVASTTSTQIDDLDINVTHKFTALIHGNVPEWKNSVQVQIPNNGPRNWKRFKADDSNPSVNEVKDSSGEVNSINSNVGEVSSSSPLDLNQYLSIQCTDTLHIPTSSTYLSTIQILSAHDFGRLSNVISFILRKLGHPVVNDRFCRREFAQLPRVMRNILKQKICIACDGVAIKVHNEEKDKEMTYVLNETIEVSPNKRTQCQFWQNIMQN
mmetsp:Transcript_18391/g.25913  ORF Transcript_18391/g.25913 Transcript_18391/m.25913 type:complete len:833 (-) Transcript_18391:62-2560(-)